MNNKLLKVDIQKELNEFDLEVDFELKNKRLGILGPSGCGKSMTLKSIAGIVNPDNGVVSLNTGEETTYFDSNKKINLKPQERNVGYLFQNYALFPNMTVEENVTIGLSKEGNGKKTSFLNRFSSNRTVKGNVASGLSKSDDERVAEMIKRFHLEGLEKRYPRQLSGGQQQRVALARILAYRPDVILLDEPFSAMDTFLKEQLRMELANLLRDFDGFSIMVTHDRDEAFQFCDELIILDAGKIIAKGTTYEIFENPRRVEVARLTGCKNISEIEIIDDYHLKSLDWDVTFEVSQKISPNITHIGIRAHDFSAAQKGDVNVFSTENSTVLEMPFEWEITLANGLWWKYDKQIYEHDFVIPKYLKVDPQDIILLEE
ncbi:sulfate/molybdate ABC transporter ATP-binding protein [uncultured Methanobrevibacter sp.]|uniref:sulfate/molybdate ABC transporter ATP-binding protein n=1 Tax=uncultured Methanobrevibacter sp. TaxID=253161 RepID=UPI002606628E|nr:ATP-binding cassette domain-containing protein [uncultured Methanobrevibacter sp.]